MAYSIRQYVETDLDGVISSWENASKIAHPFLSEEFLDKERYNIPNLYLPNADTWVADIEKICIGFIALLGNEIGAIFVEPIYQGSGIGKSLMDKAVSLHRNLELDVFEENPIGRGFYARYGFQPIGEKIHPETGLKLLRLRYCA